MIEDNIYFCFFVKNMREGVAKKRGIMTKNSVIASSTIHLDRQLKDLPSSMYIE